MFLKNVHPLRMKGLGIQSPPADVALTSLSGKAGTLNSRKEKSFLKKVLDVKMQMRYHTEAVAKQE